MISRLLAQPHTRFKHEDFDNQKYSWKQAKMLLPDSAELIHPKSLKLPGRIKISILLWQLYLSTLSTFWRAETELETVQVKTIQVCCN